MDHNRSSQPAPSGFFGIYRWLLASGVVMAHLGPKEMASVGFYAVFAFYTLSGYLMTLVFSEHYRVMQGGLRRYLLNRFLRIFPLYWVALALAFAVLYFFPGDARPTHPLFGIPDNGWGWFNNATLLGVVNIHGIRPDPLLIPSAWSLKAECIFYVLLPLMLCSPNVKLLLLTLMLGYPLLVPGTAFSLYYSPFAAGLPFATGMGIYHLHSKRKWPVPAWLFYGAIALLLGLSLPCDVILSMQMRIKLYAALAANAVIIRFLCQLSASRFSPCFQRFDNTLGHISYAIYLIHIPAGALCYALLKSHLQPDSAALFAAALVPVNACAWLLYRYVESPINRLRIKVKFAPEIA